MCKVDSIFLLPIHFIYFIWSAYEVNVADTKRVLTESSRSLISSAYFNFRVAALIVLLCSHADRIVACQAKSTNQANLDTSNYGTDDTILWHATPFLLQAITLSNKFEIKIFYLPLGIGNSLVFAPINTIHSRHVAFIVSPHSGIYQLCYSHLYDFVGRQKTFDIAKNTQTLFVFLSSDGSPPAL